MVDQNHIKRMTAVMLFRAMAYYFNLINHLLTNLKKGEIK